MNSKRHFRAALVFWASCCLLLTAFAVEPLWLSIALYLFVIPVFFGSHEAVHGTLVERSTVSSRFHRVHNVAALYTGFALQGMNFLLMRPAHLHHHVHGRYDEGYAPDVFPAGSRKWRDIGLYYLTLIALPAVAWQLAGFAVLVVPRKYLPFLLDINWERNRTWVQYAVVQFGVVGFALYAITVGGWFRYVLFQVVFCFIWSVLQNAPHNGLRGFDPESDKVCAHTYLLDPVSRLLTFGSTSHLAHHVEMNVPGAYLHRRETLERVEEKLGVQIVRKFGLWSFIRDILRQFKGPVTPESLEAGWCIGEPQSDRDPNPTYGYRAGRLS